MKGRRWTRPVDTSHVLDVRKSSGHSGLLQMAGWMRLDVLHILTVADLATLVEIKAFTSPAQRQG